MLIKDAITYLTDTKRTVNDRFKVLTGFDTLRGCKDRSSESSTNYWVNALNSSNVIKRIETTKARSSWGGLFSATAGAFLGSDLQGQLKAAYKKGSEASEEQLEGQQEYIKIVADYLTEHQANENLISFHFYDPEKLAATVVESALEHSYH